MASLRAGGTMAQPLEYEPGAARIGAFHRAFNMMSAPLLALLTIVSTWLSATFGLVLVPVPIALAALLVPRRRWGLLALCAALSPMSVGLMLGAAGYCTGTATVQGMGLPGLGYFNLDPELRCERSTGGCLVNGGEVLTHGPHNFAVVALTRLFGPQPGAYTGPYPNESQARAALASATPVSFELLVNDRVDVTSPAIKLDVGVGHRLLQRTQLAMLHGMLPDEFAREQLDEYGPVRATLYQNRCLILRIPEPDPASAMIVLLDATNGRPFAYYGEGQFHQRFPPVAWRK